MKRFYDCIEIVIPKKDWLHDGCPIDGENCYNCKYMKAGGTLGGERWIDCSYDEEKGLGDDSTVDQLGDMASWSYTFPMGHLLYA